jgi:hypothetical protein
MTHPTPDCVWSSHDHNIDHATQTIVRVYTPDDLALFPLDNLRLAHQALIAAAADVLDCMADLVQSPTREAALQPLQESPATDATATH